MATNTNASTLAVESASADSSPDGTPDSKFTATADIARRNKFWGDDFRRFIRSETTYAYDKHGFSVSKLYNPAKKIEQLYVLTSDVEAIIEAYKKAKDRHEKLQIKNRRMQIDHILLMSSHDELVEIFAELKGYFRRCRRNASSPNSVTQSVSIDS